MMGTAQVNSMLLLWLLQDDLSLAMLLEHVRAYILFMIGYFFDTKHIIVTRILTVAPLTHALGCIW
ncbi:hypothetical protein KFK09_003536 [Dendrobium nobile]|uniref:Uncharacterized protein n=1 Tax=Dendrobium nobile TaxID=94219 RepID=A0A8T3BXV6_DENNO|nr:hypothetical protein KFK09_003536 [Dendrobium nobile]